MKYYLPDNLMEQRPLVVTLLGAGGTGGEVLNGLLRIHLGLIARGGLGLHVRVYDPAMFREANVGRQRCLPAEVGQYKSLALVNRLNMAYGLNWEAYPAALGPEAMIDRHYPDLLIGCVDKAAVRADFSRWFEDVRMEYMHHDYDPLLWLDFGNGRHEAQVILGELLPSANNDFRLPHVGDLFPALQEPEQFDADDMPSCSLAEAIGPNGQDLMVNTLIANHGINLLWQLLTTGKLSQHGVFMDVRQMTASPLPIDTEAWTFYGFERPLHQEAA